MADPESLPFLKDGQLLLVNFGAGGDIADDLWVALEVSRSTRVFKFLQNFVNNETGFLPLAPFNVAASPGVTQANYVSGTYVFPSAVTGVTDALEPMEPGEILQGFIGVAPQWLRVFFKQPVNTLEDTMDQNIVPSASLNFVSYVDGYPDSSPFIAPTPRGEFVSLRKSSLNFDLENPSGAITYPEFMILVKRMKLGPATDPDRVHQSFQGRIPAKKWTIGDPLKTGSWSGANYEGLKALPLKSFLSAEYATLMKAAGYGVE